MLGVWGCAPSGVQDRVAGQELWGEAPQYLKAFCCVFPQRRCGNATSYGLLKLREFPKFGKFPQKAPR